MERFQNRKQKFDSVWFDEYFSNINSAEILRTKSDFDEKCNFDDFRAEKSYQQYRQ